MMKKKKHESSRISQASHDENSDNDDNNAEGNNGDSQQTETPVITPTQPASSSHRTVAKRPSTSLVYSSHATPEKRVRRKKWVCADHQMNLLLFPVRLSSFLSISWVDLFLLNSFACKVDNQRKKNGWILTVYRIFFSLEFESWTVTLTIYRRMWVNLSSRCLRSLERETFLLRFSLTAVHVTHWLIDHVGTPDLGRISHFLMRLYCRQRSIWLILRLLFLFPPMFSIFAVIRSSISFDSNAERLLSRSCKCKPSIQSILFSQWTTTSPSSSWTRTISLRWDEKWEWHSLMALSKLNRASVFNSRILSDLYVNCFPLINIVQVLLILSFLPLYLTTTPSYVLSSTSVRTVFRTSTLPRTRIWSSCPSSFRLFWPISLKAIPETDTVMS